jgi:hypothetical protein
MRRSGYKLMTILTSVSRLIRLSSFRARALAKCGSRGFHALLVAGAFTTCNPALAMEDPAHEPYTCSWQADNNLGGTETMSLVAHQGKLYAGIGYWEDTGSYPGSQILVLDSPKGNWRVDHTFSAKLSDGTPEYRRVAVLKEITFDFDGRGNRLSTPVSLLLAANDNTHQPDGSRVENLAIFSRDDSSGRWIKMTLPIMGRGIRSLGKHHDPTSGADYVFLGTCSNGFVRGSYDASKEGKISWSINSEPAQPTVAGRIMAFGDLAGALCAFAKPSLYQYEDGSPGSVRAKWREMYSYPQPQNARSSGLRGATNINGSLFGFLEATGSDSKIMRMFPPVEELNIRRFLKSKLGTDFVANGQSADLANIVGAYNDFTKVIDPMTRRETWLVGLGFNEKNVCSIPNKEHSAWFLARSAADAWTLHEIPSLNLRDPQPCPPAVRTMVVSPFAGDREQAIYIGFYDANDRPCHNTAHIYRVGLATALRPYSSDKFCSSRGTAQ